MVVSVSEFHQKIVDSQILDEKSVRMYSSHLQAGRGPISGEEFASALVKGGILTSYQAKVIYHGRGTALVLGNYVVMDKIGAGGMGRIYRAKHRLMDRIVALKVLPPDLANHPTVVQRFEREVKAAAQLHHPNIVMAFDADCASGRHFMVMEYIRGIDLSALVKQRGVLSVARSLSYIYQAARGLHYAHIQKMIHRDVKPGNLMVDASETVKILDLGLVMFKDSIRNSSIINLTNQNVVLGTVDFMSPEQAMNSKYVDERGDIYSLGMTLYYLLVGKPAYGGKTAVERLLAHRDAPLPSLSEARDDVDSRLDAIFRKMIAKTPQDRYQSMLEVIDALTEYSSGFNPEEPQTKNSPTDDENLNAFLLSLETTPSVVRRTRDDSPSATIQMAEAPSHTGLPVNAPNSEAPHDRAESTIDSSINAHSGMFQKAAVVLGILAVIVIAILAYQLGKTRQATSLPTSIPSPASTGE
ncbi:MAG TPA: serine/threonine-protein kinase [Planctomycetaceae bacterium]|nr:serine/threonine-protein kinase [Planctomycetaceae bacterium]